MPALFEPPKGEDATISLFDFSLPQVSSFRDESLVLREIENYGSFYIHSVLRNGSSLSDDNDVMCVRMMIKKYVTAHKPIVRNCRQSWTLKDGIRVKPN